MAALNQQLKEYLSRNDDKSGDKATLLPTTIKDIKLPKLSTWFQANDVTSDNDSSASSTKSCFSAAESDPLLPSLGRKQRILGFLCCVVMGIVCFSLSAMFAPFLLIKARKFALLFTLGSLFSVLSFSFLWGPVNHLKHLFSSERLMFTTVYLISLLATLYSALALQSTVMTSIAAIVQVGALLCFVLSNVPGGKTGLKFFSSICSSLIKKTVSRALPV